MFWVPESHPAGAVGSATILPRAGIPIRVEPAALKGSTCLVTWFIVL